MTGSDDFFGQVDEAEAVTDDQTDSIQPSVEQTEADGLRTSAEHYTRLNYIYGATAAKFNPQYVARCRFCRREFK